MNPTFIRKNTKTNYFKSEELSHTEFTLLHVCFHVTQVQMKDAYEDTD